VQKLRVSTWRRLVLTCFILIFFAIVYRWISLERLQRAVAPAEPVPTHSPEPTATPRPSVITGKIDTAKLFNGITLHATVETPPGADASTERADPQNYIVELQLEARMPKPNQTIDELAKISPQLPALLPGLAGMLTPDAVSPFFSELYATKVKITRENLGHLDQLLSRHNFYDCQTVLQLNHPKSHRKALLLQADMDVDADGSDGDRVPGGHGISTNFKPFTSYRWAKKTPAENPYLPATEEKLKRYEDEAALKTTTAERKRELRGAINQLRDEVGSLKKFSFLIGATDPYIVVPSVFVRAHNGPKVGDYAVVIFADAAYPALVGDVGPNDKVGEASLRIAKEINNLATPYNRPVSDLKVTYLIFPGTADTPFGPPDLDKIQTRCQVLIDEIGGATKPLHHWENIIPPPPTPTPVPTATATIEVSATPSSTASPTSGASPAATFAFPISSPSSSPNPNGSK
jgi:hypothetical protein